jgi:hypothetical protein
MTTARFRQLCADTMVPADLEALNAVLDDSTAAERHPFGARWRRADLGLRATVARARAARLKCDVPAEAIAAPWDAPAERAVTDAFNRPTPADREMALDRHRWSVLEELAGFDAFDASAMIAYGMKLKIAERWARMDAAKGMDRIDRLCDQPPSGTGEKQG